MNERATPDILPPACQTVLGDFYQSFRFSQTKNSTQFFLFVALFEQYAHGMDSDQAETVIAHKDMMTERVKHMRPPARHARTAGTTDDIAGEFMIDWNNFMTCNGGFDNIARNAHRCKKPNTKQIARSMILQDTVYMDRGRPGRQSLADKHESYFRSYVVLQTLTGSAAYDNIFGDMRTKMFSDPQARQENVYYELETAWEERFPGERFNPLL